MVDPGSGKVIEAAARSAVPRRQAGPRRAERVRRGTLGAVLHRGARLRDLRRLSGGDGSGRHGVSALQRRPSRHRARRLDDDRGRECRAQPPCLRGRHSRRGRPRARPSAPPRGHDRFRRSPPRRMPARGRIPRPPTITGWRSTGASIRSAATGKCARRPSGRACRASRRPSPTRFAARTRHCTIRRCSRRGATRRSSVRVGPEITGGELASSLRASQ
jgi:hypothetical protein